MCLRFEWLGGGDMNIDMMPGWVTSTRYEARNAGLGYGAGFWG